MEQMMDSVVEGFDQRLGGQLKLLRLANGWSLDEVAARSGVSRAMVHRVETGGASATAALLGRLAGAFGLSLSRLMALAEPAQGPMLRTQDQPVWRDPATGLVRRQVTGAGAPVELVAVELPAGASVSYPPSAYRSIAQVIWVMAGRLEFTEGAVVHSLEAGDSLALGAPARCQFHNPADQPCRYLVAVAQRAPG
jgi:transcriptional regulator with XRE-family HTH domain